MWRLVPVLAILGFLEVLVPWPDVAALVLNSVHHADTPAISLHTVTPVHTAPPVAMRREPSQLIVQVRDTTP